jgi:hypothetical protein
VTTKTDEIPFDVLVERLTRAHEVPIHNDDEGTTVASRDGLLQQLREAVFGSSDRGATAANKAKLPMNAAALDLYTLIDRQVAEVWGAAFSRVPGAEKPEALVAQWSAHVDPFAIVRYSTPETVRRWSDKFREDVEHVVWTLNEASPYNLLARWHRAISELFDPPRLITNPAACVSCGARSSYRRLDGQTVKSTALVIEVDRMTNRPKEVRCLACEASWGPALFEWLNQAITENEKRHADAIERIDETTAM